MPENLTTFRCLLISPGDVAAERRAVVDAVRLWNAQIGAGMKASVEVVAWESHARPEMGGAPQDVINKQLVDGCDFGVAVFWWRLGSPTTEHPSGSAEEVARLLGRGANVMVYFSTRDVPQEALGDDQFARLQELKKDYRKRGLLTSYSSPEHLAALVTLHLSSLVAGLLVTLRAGGQPVPSTGTATAPKPDIRVKLSSVMVHSGGLEKAIAALVRVVIQNHSPQPFYFASISFALDGAHHVMIARDELSKEPIMPRTIEPGDSMTVLLAPETWALAGRGITGAIVSDKIERTYVADPDELKAALDAHESMRATVGKM